MEEELSGGFRLMILDVAKAVFVNMGVVKEGLVVLDPGKGIAQLAFAGAQSFDFGAFEHNAGLECFEDMIIAARFGIGENLGHG